MAIGSILEDAVICRARMFDGLGLFATLGTPLTLTCMIVHAACLQA
jgi:hypothetical protein